MPRLCQDRVLHRSRGRAGGRGCAAAEVAGAESTVGHEAVWVAVGDGWLSEGLSTGRSERLNGCPSGRPPTPLMSTEPCRGSARGRGGPWLPVFRRRSDAAPQGRRINDEQTSCCG